MSSKHAARFNHAYAPNFVGRKVQVVLLWEGLWFHGEGSKGLCKKHVCENAACSVLKLGGGGGGGRQGQRLLLLVRSCPCPGKVEKVGMAGRKKV